MPLSVHRFQLLNDYMFINAGGGCTKTGSCSENSKVAISFEEEPDEQMSK